MSNAVVRDALRARFDAVRRSEIARLKRKFADLSETERESVEAIVARVVDALVLLPSQTLATETAPPETLHAIVQLFDLRPQA